MTELDTRLFSMLHGAPGSRLLAVALVLSAVGDGWILLGLVPLYASPRWRRLAVSLAATAASSAAAVFALKLIVGRVRPCAALAGVHALCTAPTDPSFPSGHASGAFTVVSFLIVVLGAREALRGRPVARGAMTAALVAVAVGIAWSRVYLGVHYPGDVAAGAVLGSVSGSAGAWMHLRRPPLRHL
jgi:undecaprenyl-diphosphatase